MPTFKEKVIGVIEKMIRETDTLKSWINASTAGAAKGALTSLLHRIKEIPDDNGWIKCSERMPKVYDRVLTSDNLGIMKVLKYNITSWTQPGEGYSLEEIIAWQPLPPPPNQE